MMRRRRSAATWLVIIGVFVPWASALAQQADLLRLMPDESADIAQAIEIQERNTDALFGLDGVLGTGIAIGPDGYLAVQVYTRYAGVSGIPTDLEGLRVVIVETGEIIAAELDGYYRPVPIGVSVGNVNDCATGTIGCVVEKGGEKYILSNNHILARLNAASIGEPISQPGLKDFFPECVEPPINGSTPRVAMLTDFEPILFDGSDNIMDAAIADYITSGVLCSAPPPYTYYPSANPVAPQLGMAIKKVGKKTELTTDVIAAINVTISVTYLGVGTAKFVGQFATSKYTAFGAGGDSGSLVVTDDLEANPVGLLFAVGSVGTTFSNPIQPVLTRFGVTVCTRDLWVE